MCTTLVQNQGALEQWQVPHSGQKIHKISKGCHVVPRKKKVIREIMLKRHRSQNQGLPLAQSGII